MKKKIIRKTAKKMTSRPKGEVDKLLESAKQINFSKSISKDQLNADDLALIEDMIISHTSPLRKKIHQAENNLYRMMKRTRQKVHRTQENMCQIKSNICDLAEDIGTLADCDTTSVDNWVPPSPFSFSILSRLRSGVNRNNTDLILITGVAIGVVIVSHFVGPIIKLIEYAIR